LGKFFAKAVMDFRVVDIQLSYVFYKWLIDPQSLCADDIKYIDTQLFKSIDSLKEYLRKKRNLMLKAYMLKDSNDNIAESLKSIQTELSELEKTVLDLDLDFTLPGYNNIELKKGGKDIIVTLENLDEYLNVSLRLLFLFILFIFISINSS
jgi:E3 ubiquitin-protein ligase TRIP12